MKNNKKMIALSIYTVLVTIIAALFGGLYFTVPKNKSDDGYLTQSQSSSLITKVCLDLGIIESGAESQNNSKSTTINAEQKSITIKAEGKTIDSYFSSQASLKVYINVCNYFMKQENVQEKTYYEDEYLVTESINSTFRFYYENIIGGVKIHIQEATLQQETILTFIAGDTDGEWEMVAMSNAPLVQQRGTCYGAAVLECNIKDGQILDFYHSSVATSYYGQNKIDDYKNMTSSDIKEFIFEYYSFETSVTIDTTDMTDDEKLIMSKLAYKNIEGELLNWSDVEEFETIDIIENALS